MSGRVAVVTGASRGVGKGVACALGEAGWTVYVTGRSRNGQATSRHGGTIEDTAAAVTAHGGEGVAVACDHRDDEQVRQLFERVAEERNGLDMLVNNVFAVPDGVLQEVPYWQRSLADWDDMVGLGLRAHYVASVYAAPIMVASGAGLIANISSFGARARLHTAAYGVSKAGADKLARDIAPDLAPYGVTALSLWLGPVSTERTVAALDAAPDALNGFDLSMAETPEFPGRVLAALAADERVSRWNGAVLIAAEVAREYGVTERDGSQPASLRPVLGSPEA